MSEIAQLFTEFFRDLDVVPSDVVAGLVLLRHHQKQRMKMVVAQVQFLVLFIHFFGRERVVCFTTLLGPS